MYILGIFERVSISIENLNKRWNWARQHIHSVGSTDPPYPFILSHWQHKQAAAAVASVPSPLTFARWCHSVGDVY